MEKPLVSIIIPTYNRLEYLKKAINSALNQTYKNIELIIIDDCSGGNAFENILQFCKEYPQVFVFKNEFNLGFVKTLNKGIALAHGKYIARLDDDDTWPDIQKIEKQVNFLEKNKDYVLVGGGVIKTDKSGKEISRYLLPETNEDIKKTILSSNVFIHSSVLFLKSLCKKAGGYKDEYGFFADWELWLSIGRFGKFYNFPEIFVNYLDNDLEKIGNSHDVKIRRRIKESIKMKNNYRNFYPGFNRAIIFSFLSYLYSFLPFREIFFNQILKIKKVFLKIK